jgi:hypothetical protein
MLVIIDAKLTTPPSSVSCFRDVTLYSNCFLKSEVVIECNKGLRDLYWKWLKSVGAFDFVEDFVNPLQENGVRISKSGNISVDRIIEHNLNFILYRLRRV